jgi:two-component system, chemotaxis family, chemotaxis protein CheY
MIGCGKTVLVVDDDGSERGETALMLEQAGFTIVQACDGLDAMSEMQQQHFDAVVTDFHMPYMDGLELLAQSRVIWSDTPVIIVSKAEWDLNEMAMAKGAFAWICKSSSPGVLLSMLAMAVEQGVKRNFANEIQVVAA